MRGQKPPLIATIAISLMVVQGCQIETLKPSVEVSKPTERVGQAPTTTTKPIERANQTTSTPPGTDGTRVPAIQTANRTGACPELEPDMVRSVVAWTDHDWYQHRATADDIRRCLAAGADPNARNSVSRKRVLHLASQYASAEMVAELIAAGANLEARDGDGLTALHLASVYNRVDTLQVLLHRRADPNSATHDGFTSLHAAAMAFQTMNIRHGHDGRCSGPVKNFATLLSYGARLGGRDGTDATPFERAGRWEDDLRRLLSEKCNVTAVGGRPPAQTAATTTRTDAGACPELEPDMVRSVVAWTDHDWYQHHATADDVRRCLAVGADPNAQNAVSKKRVLHLAAQHATAEVVAELIGAGANLEARDGDGLTALHLAAVYHRVDTLQVLLHRRADPNSATRDGFTPLHAAGMAFQDMNIRHGHDGRCSGPVKNFSTLLEYGARLGGRDGTGATPFERAGRWEDDLRRLLSEKCNVTAVRARPSRPEASSERPNPICSEAKSKHACWLELANQKGCFVWSPSRPGLTTYSVTWSGDCLSGKASGTGVSAWTAKGSDGQRVTWREEGSYLEGKKNRHWVEQFVVVGASRPTVLKGPYVDGERHGHWVEQYAIVGASRPTVWKGPYVNGKRHGRWVAQLSSGHVNKGPYVNGKRHGRWILGRPDGRCGAVAIMSHGKELRRKSC